MVRVVRVRANASFAVLGAAARSLCLGEAGVAAKAGTRLRGDAAEALDQSNDCRIALDGASASR